MINNRIKKKHLHYNSLLNSHYTINSPQIIYIKKNMISYSKTTAINSRKIRSIIHNSTYENKGERRRGRSYNSNIVVIANLCLTIKYNYLE